MLKKSGILLLLLLCIMGCKKQATDTPELYNAHDYFPLEEGVYWIHHLSFITIDVAIGVYDSTEMEIKTKFAGFDSSLDQYRLNRYFRLDSLDEWSDYDGVLVSWEGQSFLWYENNYRFLKLTDPVFEGKSWDGNSYNILAVSDYFYSALNTTFEIEGVLFESTITVDKRNINNAIQKSRAYEVFAKGIGSVYEYDSDFSYQAGLLVYGNSKESKLIKFDIE
jgi:hypothetical protein